MTTPCGALRDRLPEYLEDSLSADERRAFREHLSSCAECREDMAEVEPSLLFARIPAAEVSSDDVLRVLAGVRAGIALAETEKRARRGRPSHRHRVAAMASAAALAAMTLVLPGSARRPADPPAIAPVATVPSPGFAPASERQPGGTYPADATIYDWNPGAATAEPRVVWIVDRSLDI
jgi:anti-sigma factor RsiW